MLPCVVWVPDHEFELAQLVASVDDQLSVTGLLTEALVADMAMVTVGAAAVVAVTVVGVLLALLPPHAARLAASGTSTVAAAQRSLWVGIVHSRGNTRDIGRFS